jgi:hypothetical protein
MSKMSDIHIELTEELTLEAKMMGLYGEDAEAYVDEHICGRYAFYYKPNIKGGRNAGET